MTNIELNRLVAMVLTVSKGYAHVHDCAAIMKIIIPNKPLKQHKYECHSRMSANDKVYYKKIDTSTYVACKKIT